MGGRRRGREPGRDRGPRHDAARPRARANLSSRRESSRREIAMADFVPSLVVGRSAMVGATMRGAGAGCLRRFASLVSNENARARGGGSGAFGSASSSPSSSSSSSSSSRHLLLLRRAFSSSDRAMSAPATWDGSGTQEDLMYRDECIIVVRPRPIARPTRSSDRSRVPASLPRVVRARRDAKTRGTASHRSSVGAFVLFVREVNESTYLTIDPPPPPPPAPPSTTGRQGQHHRPRQQVRRAQVHPGATGRDAPPRVQRLPFRRSEQAPPAAARVEQDHLPVAVDEHVLLAPAVRADAERGGRPGGRRERGGPRREARGGPEAPPRARDPPGAGASPKIQVPHAAALQSRGRVRGEPEHDGRAVGRARDGLHPVHQARRPGDDRA
eukprot:14978-Pelagococcus_subviridis.AAC.9